jgi:hypothetical protein
MGRGKYPSPRIASRDRKKFTLNEGCKEETVKKGEKNVFML